VRQEIGPTHSARAGVEPKLTPGDRDLGHRATESMMGNTTKKFLLVGEPGPGGSVDRARRRAGPTVGLENGLAHLLLGEKQFYTSESFPEKEQHALACSRREAPLETANWPKKVSSGKSQRRLRRLDR
jgi:hypothetical protein